MPSTMTLQVNGYWQAGDMGREDFGMNGKGGNSATISHRSDTEVIDSVHNFLLQFSNLSIRIGLAYPSQKRSLSR